jgi:predicted RNase H-like HicB family nuclease
MEIEFDREADGRWIAEIPSLPGVLVYGATEAEARTNVIVLALRVIADRLEAGEPPPGGPRMYGQIIGPKKVTQNWVT